jgi:hypothetical protein
MPGVKRTVPPLSAEHLFIASFILSVMSSVPEGMRTISQRPPASVHEQISADKIADIRIKDKSRVPLFIILNH